MPPKKGSGGGKSGKAGAISGSVNVKRVMDGVDCSEIMPGFLYMSSIRAAQDRDALKAIGITHIINVAGAQKFPSEFSYFRCYAPDSAESNLLEKFDDMKAFIDQAANGGKPAKKIPATAASSDDGDGNDDTSAIAALQSADKKNGKSNSATSRNAYAASQLQPKCRVLVHCRGGISRSATLTIAYLMSIDHPQCTSVTETLKWLRTKRSTVRPNANFMKQLNDFESELTIKRALLATAKKLSAVRAIVQIIIRYAVVPTATITRAGETTGDADDDD